MTGKAFQFHKLTDEGMAKSKKIAELFSQLQAELEGICNPSTGDARWDYAMRNLEISSFYAKKVMAEQHSVEQYP